MHDQNKRLSILTEKEIEALYAIPQLTPEERDSFFSLDPLETKLLKSIRYLNAAVYFLRQLGYFKTKKQFFVFELYKAGDDVVYILRRYFPNVIKLPALTVSKPTRLAQQREILRIFYYQTCSQAWKRKLREQAESLVMIYSKPGYIFKELLTFLERHRVVLPGYSFMQEEVVGKALTRERKRLDQALAAGIPEEARRKLDRLLTAEESLYQLTLLKHEPKDFSYQEVEREVEKRALLTDLYQLSLKLLPHLRLSSENIKYYASLITYRPVREIK